MKNYIGKGKLGDYGNIQVSIETAKIPKELITEYKGRKYLNLTVAPMKQTDQYGKTHTVYIWQPDERREHTQTKDEPVPNTHEQNNLKGMPEYKNETQFHTEIPF